MRKGSIVALIVVVVAVVLVGVVALQIARAHERHR